MCNLTDLQREEVLRFAPTHQRRFPRHQDKSAQFQDMKSHSLSEAMPEKENSQMIFGPALTPLLQHRPKGT